MQVRDFTIDANSGVKNRGLYLGWTEPGTHLPNDPKIKTALDHLVELGVTHAQRVRMREDGRAATPRNELDGLLGAERAGVDVHRILRGAD